MILLDGSDGEGGGQILRTALALSTITGQPFRIVKIRAGRAKPGLLRQHLTGLQASAAISGGRYSDTAGLGATELEFYPGTPRAGAYEFAVGTAGSAMLVLQTVLLPLLKAEAPSRVVISGGTHNPASPPFEFIERAWLPILRRMGAVIDLKIASYGFMPAGGGRIVAEIQPAPSLQPINLLDRGECLDTSAEAFFANLPVDIAKRELDALGTALSLPESARYIREVKSSGPGNALLLTVSSELVTEVFAAFGRRRVSAEEVASMVADDATAYIKSDAAVGPYLADQLLLPLALAGSGSFTTLTPTRHTKTNAATIAKFLSIATTFDKHENGRDVLVRVRSH